MHTGSYINGKWFHPKSARLVRNINPADLDDVIAEFPAATTRTFNAPSPPSVLRRWKKKTRPGAGTRTLARGRHRAPAGR